jgi:uncharacterized protein (TIGR02145 family)
VSAKKANGTALLNSPVSFSATATASLCGNITDIDGNVYPSITIGTQCWLQKNLDVATYRNGDIIPQVTDPIAWAALTTGAWCYYENNTANGTVYGKLYNSYAVNDPRGLAPAGYHIPTDAEWTTLTTFLGGVGIAGNKMKATTLWQPYSGITNTNTSGFTGLPGGFRPSNGTFLDVGYSGFWWSSSENDSLNGIVLYLQYYKGNAVMGKSFKINGYSVRCLKD